MHVVVAISIALATQAPVTLSDNQVKSQHIAEADNTSGQNANSGSGIKTPHLADGAVTSPKLAPGAVTDAHVAGPISAAKIEQGVFQKRYAQVIVVAKDGTGDYATPNEALAAIADASAAKPYLVKIMPGVYALPGPLQLRSYVDLEGSGLNATTLVGQLLASGGVVNAEVRQLSIEKQGAGSPDDSGFLCTWGNSATKLTDVSIRATGVPGVHVYSNCVLVLDRVVVSSTVTSGNAYAIYWNYGYGSGWMAVKDSTLSASGGENAWGVYLRNAGSPYPTSNNVSLTRTVISASGAAVNVGVQNHGAAYAVLDGVKIWAATAVQNEYDESWDRGQVRVVGSDLNGALVVRGAGTLVSTSLIAGPVSSEGSGNGWIACFGNYDQNLQAVTCPP